MNLSIRRETIQIGEILDFGGKAYVVKRYINFHISDFSDKVYCSFLFQNKDNTESDININYEENKVILILEKMKNWVYKINCNTYTFENLI